MKKILILTSVKTGFGHRSSANAIEKKLRDAGYSCKQIDVFPLMGKMGNLMEESYIPMTTRMPLVYFVTERFSQFFPDVIHAMTYLGIRKELLKVIKEYEPDLILSVHCMFTKCISRLIKKNKLHIPFYIGVIDLVNPPRVWEDRQADMTFVPSNETRDKYLKKRFRSDRVLVSGFPVRDDIEVLDAPKQIENPMRIMMMNPSTDLKKNIRFVQEVARLKNVKIRLICGLDDRLYTTLSNMQRNHELPDQVEIYGFIDNINQHLKECQIILTKAGPNAIIEAVRSGTAVVITGHIKGQENHNYEYVVNNGYGICCEDPNQIYDTLYDFINSGQLMKCLKTITNNRIGNGAEVIADYVSNHI
ncbi:MAG: glycosyltransferase [Erysipelotrichaceae bacterium]|nr:glycosyltransferase [Erysipelotrichaceae bacterium]